MYSKEFKKIYHPRLGRYVYEHRGNGLIVDNLFKPLGRKAKEIGSKVIAPFLKKTAKKATQKAAQRAGEKLSQMASEKAGDLIRKRLSKTARTKKTPISNVTQRRAQETQDVNTLINNLIAMS